MVHPSIEQALRTQLDRLAIEQQQQVLAFAKSMVEQQPAGIPGESYRAFAGSIAREELARMERAIKEGCEQIDADEW